MALETEAEEMKLPDFKFTFRVSADKLFKFIGEIFNKIKEKLNELD